MTLVERELIVRISADVTAFERAMAQVGQSTQRLGREAQAAGQATATMGREQATATQGLDRNVQSADRARDALGRYASSAATATQGLDRQAQSADRARDANGRFSSSTATVTRGLGVYTDSAGRAREANGRFAAMEGSATRASDEHGRSLTKRAVQYAAVGVGLGVIVGAFKSTISAGVDYQSSLNTLQAVTSSTGQQMVQVAAKARELGNDISLPGASAQTAAAAMTELAKGGLSVSDSMAAAKGTLQLATAAQIDGAQAATIQANALNTFGLAGSSAGHVADVLANTANAASGEIGDFAQGLRQAGLVAHGMGISIDDTATTLGLFAQKGLMGADAGTTLKNMLIYLQHPTKRGTAALQELGVSAFDASGKFVGMRAITGELAAAQGRLTQQQFAAAASTAFGTRSVRAAISMAQSGVPAFDAMGAAVSKQGGAATLAAAQTKGLRGAFNLVQNAVQDAQLSLMDKLGPALDSTTRRFADLVPSITAQLVPGLASAGTAVIGLAQDGMPLLGSAAGAVGSLLGGLGTVLHTLGPVLQGIFTGVSTVAQVFSSLPGPIGTAVVALGVMFLMRGKMNTLGTSISSAFNSARSSLTSFGMQVSTNAELAAVSGTRFSGLVGGLKAIGPVAVSAGRGLMAAFGGPVGLAIVGITAAISIFSAKSAEAKQKAEDQKAAIDSLAGAYDHATGAITDAAKAQITDSLGKQADDFKQIGLSAGAAAQAVIAGTMDQGKSYDAMALKIADAAEASGKFEAVLHHLSSDGVSDLRDIVRVTGMSETAILHAVTAGGPELAKLQAAFKASGVSAGDTATVINEVRRNVENFVPSIKDLRQEWDTANGAAKQATDQTRAWSDSIAAAAKVDPSKLAAGLKAAASGSASLESSLQGQDIKNIPAVITAMSDSALKATDGLHFLTQAQVDAENKAHPLAAAVNDATGAVVGLGGVMKDAAGNLVDASGKTDLWATALAAAKAPADNLATALSDTKAAAADVTTAVDLMSAALQRSTGKDLTAEEAQRATQAAMRGVTQGIYDKARASQDDAKATRDRVTAEHDLQTLQDSGLKKGETQATRDTAIAAAKDKVASAIRSEQDAHLKNAAAQSADVQGYEAAAKAAFDLTSNATLAALATGSMATATTAGAAEMTRQRAAFIAAAEGAGIGAVAARKLADSYGLIPKNVATAFQADITTAQQHGADLYRTYDRTTGKWTAQFLTMDDAASKIKAGQVLQAYNSTTGTYTGTLTADNVKALTAFQQVKNQPASQLDKTSVISADKSRMDLALQIARAEGIPVKTLLIEGNNQDALDKIAAADRAVNAMTGKVIDITYKGVLMGGTGGSGAAKAAATGGLITGPGTGTSDSILAALSNKEFVVNAKATAKHLPLLEHINRDTPAFADGGYVGRTNYNITGAGPAPDFTKMMADAAQGMAAGVAKQMVPPTPTAGPGVVPAASSGVDRWVPLMKQVIAAKGLDVGHIEPIMYAQMSQESSGNPAAINLTDINAQMGHPSVGLLQFIPSTFAHYADPGYNTNIYDPESQMRAFCNYVPANYGSFDYLTRIGNGPYASGGVVTGSGTGTSDSILARVSNGEFLMNAKATSENLPLLHAINAGVQGFAAGGVPFPTGGGLAGYAAYQPGTREGNTLGALASMGPIIDSLRQAATDLASKAHDAAGTAWDAKLAARQTSWDESLKVSAARAAESAAAKSAAVWRQQVARDQNNRVGAAEGSRLATLATAQQRINTAKPGAARAAAYAAAAVADQATAAKVLAAQVTARKAIEAAAVAGVKSAQQHRAATVNAELTDRKAVAAANLKAAATMRAYTADQRAAQAAAVRLVAEQRAQDASARAESVLQQLSRQFDVTTTWLDTARASLDNLRTSSAQMASSIKSSIAGYDSGILGHPDQRRTANDVIAGLRFDQGKVSRFTDDLNNLKNKGLSGGLLAQIGGAGVDGGLATATALQGASKAQIATINSLVASTDKWAGVAGGIVADANYYKAIQTQAAAVNTLSAKVGRLSVDLNQIGAKVAVELGNAMDSRLARVTAQQLAILVKKGTVELSRR